VPTGNTTTAYGKTFNKPWIHFGLGGKKFPIQRYNAASATSQKFCRFIFIFVFSLFETDFCETGEMGVQLNFFHLCGRIHSVPSDLQIPVGMEYFMGSIR
jgi:hypothetical protein